VSEIQWPQALACVLIRGWMPVTDKQPRVGLESLDHIIRHSEELKEKIEYIRRNPAKLGLEDSPGSYRWLFVREITG
jgi:hypothetical protein